MRHDDARSGDKRPGDKRRDDKRPGDKRPGDKRPGDKRPGDKRRGETPEGGRHNPQPGASRQGARRQAASARGSADAQHGMPSAAKSTVSGVSAARNAAAGGPAAGGAHEAEREAELAAWLCFDPEPAPIACSDDARAQLARAGIEILPAEEILLGRYLGMLFATNERINLTRIEQASAWSRHVVDSLTLLGPLESAGTVEQAVDIGSGGGLPAIPLAIARPDIRWTLIESTGKKARFLDAVARRLGLANITVVQARAEQVARTPRRETFDVATSRAVSALGDLAVLSVPLLRVGGIMFAIKGERAGEEIAAAKQQLYELHVKVVGEFRTETNTIVAVEKERKTPAKFP